MSARYPAPRSSCEGGSILADSLLAMVVFAIIIAPIFTALRAGNRAANHAMHISHAGVLAMNAAERIKLLKLQDIPLCDTNYEATVGASRYTVTIRDFHKVEDGTSKVHNYTMRVSLASRDIATFWFRYGCKKTKQAAWLERKCA